MTGAAWREEIPRLARRLVRAFEAIEVRLGGPEARLARRPAPGAWSPLEVAEHVVLANHYLLLLVEKIAERGLARRRRGEELPAAASDWEALAAIAAHDFAWESPEHMRPGGGGTAREIALLLREQRRRCLRILGQTREGEGALHTVSMSVVSARLDLYQLLVFVTLHMERHAAQMDRS